MRYPSRQAATPLPAPTPLDTVHRFQWHTDLAAHGAVRSPIGAHAMTTTRRPSGYVQPPHWPQTVTRILNRDAGICYLCGKPGADTADHVVPVSQGGQHHDTNLKAAHRTPCHATKTEQERRQGLTRRQRRRTPKRNPNIID